MKRNTKLYYFFCIALIITLNIIPVHADTIVPLCPAGTPFDAFKYAQGTPQSDPMVFPCYWDGTGDVFISGDPSSVIGVWADDGYTLDIQPSGASYDAPVHWGVQHPVIRLTDGFTPGLNTITIIAHNWNGLSLSYGSSTGWVVDQTPYIVQVISQPATPKVSFSQPDTALCEYGCYNPPVSAVVTGLGPDQKVDLQLTYQILHPSMLRNDKKYILLENVGNGVYPITPQMFGVSCLWPGIPPESRWPAAEQKVMEIHFGANLLDPDTGNCITQPCTTGSQDYYWYPWVCGAPAPEFPSMFLPAMLIIGFLGAVLLIRRTKEN